MAQSEVSILTERHDELAGLDYHPLVLRELQEELHSKRSALESIHPDVLKRVQGQIEALKWFLELPEKIRNQKKEEK